MDRNRLALAVTFVVTVLALFVGLINLVSSISPSKLTRIDGGGGFGTERIGAALIKIEGEIHSGHSGYDSAGAQTILQQLRSIEEDPNIVGILVEINSPGGSVGASQEIYRELMYLRKEKNKKVVVSMKDIAASGGYYIAAAADKIFALGGTLTGSIGVIAIAPNIKGLLDRYGVKVRTFKEGKYKDSLSLFRDNTAEEDAMIQKMLSDTYEEFIEDVSKGRNQTVKFVQSLAEGRIYSGQDAFRNKLIDDIGGRREAVVELSKLCNYDGTIPLYEEEPNPLDRFFQLFQAKTGVFSGEKALLEELKRSPVLVLYPQAMAW
ncbi:signal peptide peptidase SppA, 36K type [Leptospira fainei serovar Hurstbridge str. BUT 6]|uniref:Signal peptide peptidase SppA, 36K type n=1 Tax=Leptospira fainei serovar Hurstbridge str. BUT 6 TaxID=1193011 RepID=S3UZ87_9LEPT|nr:signal peptide peptidase SppA [Leptospira fainei]EPG74508.1 signal peptide peptidase SppA, 36K type [Leptospira fainei serovar Hurstbridge str. BUT 6]